MTDKRLVDDVARLIYKHQWSMLIDGEKDYCRKDAANVIEAVRKWDNSMSKTQCLFIGVFAGVIGLVVASIFTVIAS